ncbi:alpha/beta fold hydrolase [Paucibacter sp. AS339]|uniref:alpha/beta fold hydrolase n=1 Tax=Paucibacter hankyongi TaxID=3133434 RepID=UPI0030B3FC8C
MNPKRPLLMATLLTLSLAFGAQLLPVSARGLQAEARPLDLELGAATARAAEQLRAKAGKPVQAEWSEHSFATPDGQLAYTRLGHGPLLVVIPGGPGGSGHKLREAFRPLASEFSIVVLDNIGRGRSARLADASRYTVDRDADDIERLRRFLGVETLALYGHSYGGLVVQAYAAQHPRSVDHLILGNTLHGARSWQEQIDGFKEWLRRNHPERWQRLLELRAQGQLSGSAEAQALFGEPVMPMYWADRAAPHGASTASADPRDAMNKAVYLAMLGPDPEWCVGGTLQDVEMLPRLKKVSAPTLLLTGRFDPVAPPSVMNEMQRALLPSLKPQALVFERSGHRPFIEEPEAWAKAVSSFLLR